MTAMSTEVDHLVVAADSLEQGAAWCDRVLGVKPAVGGRHALMGTHNLLLQMSSPTFARAYLEIIAIDPEAPPPGRPRWFGLDDREPGEPRLVQVVARTSTIESHRASFLQSGIDPGETIPLSRGDLHWQMLLRADGQMPCGLPMLIQWAEHHPADRLPASGCHLTHLSVGGIAPAHAAILNLHGVDATQKEPRAWAATIECPKGTITLHST